MLILMATVNSKRLVLEKSLMQMFNVLQTKADFELQTRM
ncbi:hypothetical protein LAC1533_0607 [Ligilactobacillus acidipiscis]|uniref:Uncharacterized protein n=1 Tax=Ligilactobacillus acidipiscis TaxID=89059 RepID=A0A1K1KMB3_9LACO|nr:hypothetical protein LAC1533_0607 [Ligilactobacillus acidipiscis]